MWRRLWRQVQGRLGCALGRAEERLRPGVPPAAVALAVALLPLLLVGPLRYVTGLPLWASAVLAPLVATAVAATFWPLRRVRAVDWPTRLALAGTIILVGAAASFLLYNRDFGGLPFYVDGTGSAFDGGSHIWQYQLFVHEQPELYAGFVSLYGLWAVVARLASGRLDLACNLSFHLGVWATVAAPVLVSAALLSGLPRGRRLVGALVCLGGLAALHWLVLLPLAAVNLVSGFWSHLFGLVPLMGVWLVDALVRPRLLRLGGVAFGVVLYRYTYGLNLADLLLAVALLLFVEAGAATGAAAAAPGASGRRSLLFIGLGFACVLASDYAFGQLRTIVNTWGWIVRHDREHAAWGQLLLAAALGWLLFSERLVRPPADDRLFAALRLPLAFGAANLLFQLLVMLVPNANYYYPQKYGLHAVVLLCGALVVALAWTAARLEWRRLLAAVPLLVLVGSAVAALVEGFALYRPIFDEVAFGRPKYEHLRPWIDRTALAFIHGTLERTGKEFGGFRPYDWAELVFMNSLLRFGGPDFWRDKKVDARPGRCVFWEPGVARELDAPKERDCIDYLPAWQLGPRPKRLCARCR